MLLLPNGQTGEAWEPAKSNLLAERGQHWIEKYFPLFFFFQSPNGTKPETKWEVYRITSYA